MILDYPGGPSAITRILTRERGRQEKRSQGDVTHRQRGRSDEITDFEERGPNLDTGGL